MEAKVWAIKQSFHCEGELRVNLMECKAWKHEAVSYMDEIQRDASSRKDKDGNFIFKVERVCWAVVLLERNDNGAKCRIEAVETTINI